MRILLDAFELVFLELHSNKGNKMVHLPLVNQSCRRNIDVSLSVRLVDIQKDPVRHLSGFLLFNLI